MNMEIKTATVVTRRGAYINAENGLLAPPPERTGTPLRAPDSIDWLAEPVALPAYKPSVLPPTPQQRRRANAHMVALGISVGMTLGAWAGIVPGSILTHGARTAAHGAICAYGVTVGATFVNAYLPAAHDDAHAHPYLGDFALAAGVTAGLAVQLAFFGVLG